MLQSGGRNNKGVGETSPLVAGRDRNKVEIGKSLAELDLSKENIQTLDSPAAKQMIWKQRKNYQSCGIREVKGEEGIGIKEPQWEPHE